MNTLAWLLVGIVLGSVCTLALLSLMRAASDADNYWERTFDQMPDGSWHRVDRRLKEDEITIKDMPRVTDEERREARATVNGFHPWFEGSDEQTTIGQPLPDDPSIMFTPEGDWYPHFPTRRGPYNWQMEITKDEEP